MIWDILVGIGTAIIALYLLACIMGDDNDDEDDDQDGEGILASWGF